MENGRIILRGERYRHRKRGSIYVVNCIALLESNGEPIVVYTNELTGERWARPESEFIDGRFEPIEECDRQ